MFLEGRTYSSKDSKKSREMSSPAKLLVFMSTLALFLAACGGESAGGVYAAPDTSAISTAVYNERVQHIGNIAALLSDTTFDWESYAPCALSTVRVEVPVANAGGSGSLINRRTVISISPDNSQTPQEVIQLTLSGHQLLDDLDAMRGQTITLKEPDDGQGAIPWQGSIISASRLVDISENRDDIISVVAVGPAGLLAQHVPVMDKIGTGLHDDMTQNVRVTSIPSGALYMGLLPTNATLVRQEGDRIVAQAEISQDSASVIQGSSGGGVCRNNLLEGVAVRSSSTSSSEFEITSFDENSLTLLRVHMQEALNQLSSNSSYIIP